MCDPSSEIHCAILSCGVASFSLFRKTNMQILMGAFMEKGNDLSIYLPPAGNLGRLGGLIGNTGLLAKDKEMHMFNIELWLLVFIGS